MLKRIRLSFVLAVISPPTISHAATIGSDTVVKAGDALNGTVAALNRNPTLNAAGQVGFITTRVEGVGASGLRSDAWRWDGDQSHAIALHGDVPAGVGQSPWPVTFSLFKDIWLVDGGRAVVDAELESPSGSAANTRNNRGLWSFDPSGQGAKLMRYGDPHGALELGSFNTIRVNRFGTASVEGRLYDYNGLEVVDQQRLQFSVNTAGQRVTHHAEGDQAGSGTVLYPGTNSSALNDNRKTAAALAVQSGPSLWSLPDREVFMGSVAPFGQGTTYAGIEQQMISINNQDDAVFGASLDTSSFLIDDTNKYVLVSTHRGKIAQSGDTLAGVADRHLASFGQPLLNTQGDVAFGASLRSASDPLVNEGSTLRHTADGLEVLLRPGDKLPHRQALISYATPVAMNGRGDVLIRTFAGETGLWMYVEELDRVVNVIEIGQDIELVPGDVRTVKNFSYASDSGFASGGEDGRPEFFNDQRQVALRVVFSDNSTAVLRRQVTPGSTRTLPTGSGVNFDSLGGTQITGNVSAALDVTREGVLEIDYQPSTLADLIGQNPEVQALPAGYELVQSSDGGDSLWTVAFSGSITAAELTTTYDGAALSPEDEAMLRVLHHVDGVGWIDQPATFDLLAGRVTVEVDQFSPFILTVIPEPATAALVGICGLALLPRRRTSHFR